MLVDKGDKMGIVFACALCKSIRPLLMGTLGI
jgi:hypothetical protein